MQLMHVDLNMCFFKLIEHNTNQSMGEKMSKKN